MSAYKKEELENELSDYQNVEDQSSEEDTSISDDLFSISSFGVDHNVEALVKRLKKGTYYVPEFQREYVWSQNDASKFIESLLLGLPVPGIFLYKEQEGSKHIIIDGQQRLKSLQFFYKGTFKGKEFKLTGLKTKWNGYTFEQLDEDDQERLDDAVIHATIFKQDTPTDNMNSVYEVFERINTGGMKLSPQEIRSCIAYGSFNTLLFELNENGAWREIFGNKSNRLKDIELILRFFAFLENRENYKRPMKTFLNDFMTQHKNLDGDRSGELKEIWEYSTQKAHDSLGEKPFRPSGRALNAAIYDSFLVGIASLKLEGKSVSNEGVAQAYSALTSSDEYMSVISSSTADDENVRKRFQAAKGELEKNAS